MATSRRRDPGSDRPAPCSRTEGAGAPAEWRLTRRGFVTLAAAGATGLAFGVADAAVAFAGPFQAVDPAHPIPADKKLAPAWVRALFDRGAPQTWRGKDLEKIGLPVGGICAGTLYLGGDGRLWLWDIFNQNAEGILPKTVDYDGQRIRSRDGSAYVDPPGQVTPFEQGFGLRLTTGAGAALRHLDGRGFRDITFRGEYPIGLVEYRDADVPLAVSLEAFSPFIPLGAEDSSLPVTVMRFVVRNTGRAPAAGEIVGWMQNAVGLYSKAGRQTTVTHREGRLAALEHAAADADPALPDAGTLALGLADPETGDRVLERDPAFDGCGSVSRSFSLDPGHACVAAFLVAWRFPNLALSRVTDTGHRHATRFASAAAAAAHVASRLSSLRDQTRLWRDTWYDSSLPFWFLDRTFVNTSVLATTTAHWLGTGRFYAWEGVGCCEGTCTHVWHYAQAMARIFPELERNLRERTDFGLAFHADTGLVNYRGERGGLAADGQAGVILRAYREHQMSKDDGFLRANWPKIRLALRHLIALDGNGDGLIDSAQPNTLDAAWYGVIPWISSLYHAALRAGEEMAREAGDEAFGRECRAIFERGVRALDAATWDEDKQYYVQRPDPRHLDRVGSYDGCHIDQVMGQSWAWQVGLGRVMDETHCRAALRSLWRYNFAPDVGPFRARQRSGRWYAMPGEAGLVMVTHPFGRAREFSGGDDAWTAGYFNECMSGFEYQVAGHMIREDMVEEGLAIVRAIHDRYDASRRNPYNEVECSDHYARAMASYGAYLAACGFEYHGPKAHIGFAPKVAPDRFRAAFTAAEGWGTFAQQREGARLSATLVPRWGRLRLRSVALEGAAGRRPRSARVAAGARTVAARLSQDGRRIVVTFATDLVVEAGQRIDIQLE